jgi:hypothetical protein
MQSSRNGMWIRLDFGVHRSPCDAYWVALIPLAKLDFVFFFVHKRRCYQRLQQKDKVQLGAAWSLFQKGTGLVVRSTLRTSATGRWSGTEKRTDLDGPHWCEALERPLPANEVCPHFRCFLYPPAKLHFVFFFSPNYLCRQGLRQGDKVQPPWRFVKSRWW